MSFVFISHASADKTRIRPIVDALLDARIKVWLDNPVKAGYSAAETEAKFLRLHADQPWEEEIREALKKSALVIGCFSRHFEKNTRHTLHDEIANAVYDGKLIACRIDDVTTDDLPASYRGNQAPKLDRAWDLSSAAADGSADEAQRMAGETLKLFINDVKDRLRSRLETEARDRAAVDDFLPYLIDRTSQEGDVCDALEDLSRARGGVRPMFLAAPSNECPDEFRDRLKRFTAPAILAGQPLDIIVVDWPAATELSGFQAEYRKRLSRAVKLPGTASPDELASELASRPRPPAVFSFLTCESFHHDSDKRIRNWLEFWQDVGWRAPGLKAMPILELLFPESPAGWSGCPSVNAPDAIYGNKKIWKIVKEAERRSRGGMARMGLFRCEPDPFPLSVTEILAPVTQNCFTGWLEEHSGHLNEHQRRALLTKRDAIFAKAKRGQVALRDFAREVAEEFGGA